MLGINQTTFTLLLSVAFFALVAGLGICVGVGVYARRLYPPKTRKAIDHRQTDDSADYTPMP